MKKDEKHAGGRPKLFKKTVMKAYRIDPATQANLELLSTVWACSEAEVLRRAVREASERL